MMLSDKKYNEIYSLVPRACVDLVVVSDKGVLMIKRDVEPYKGKWHLPGGRILFRETIENAVKRIAKKEIRCGVKVKCLIGAMEFLREVQNGSKRHSVSIVCGVEIIGKNKNGEYIKEGNIHPVHLNFLKEKNIL